MNIHGHICGCGSGELPCSSPKHCHYLSCVSRHLDELSGYYLHHLSHLWMIQKDFKKIKNQSTKQIIRQTNQKSQPSYHEVEAPVWGLHWREYTGDRCPRSCDDRRWRCTSSDA